MSAATPYLAAEAATLGDKELPPRHHPRPVMAAHVNQELLYAADLFQRAERAITAEIAALGASGVFLNPLHALRVTGYLANLAAEAQLAAISATEGRA